MRQYTSDNPADRHSHRRRVICATAIFLALGVITTVAVAWAAAYGSKNSTFASYNSSSTILRAPEVLSKPQHIDQAQEPIEFYACASGFGRTSEMWSTMPAWDDYYPGFSPKADHHNITWRIDSAGWPLRSLRACNEWSLPLAAEDDVQPSHDPLANLWEQGILVRSHQGRIRFGNERNFLPIRPLPLGFALDTLFYAVVFAAAWFGVGSLKRWRRRKHGLCPNCAYPVPKAARQALPRDADEQLTDSPQSRSSRCVECGRLL